MPRPYLRDKLSSKEEVERFDRLRGNLKEKIVFRLASAGFTLEQSRVLVERFSGIYQNAELGEKGIPDRPKRLLNQIIRQQKKLRNRLTSFGFTWPEVFNLMNIFFEYATPTDGRTRRPFEGDELFAALYQRHDSPAEVRKLLDNFYSPVAVNRQNARTFYNMMISDRIQVIGRTWYEEDRRGYNQWRKLQKK